MITLDSVNNYCNKQGYTGLEQAADPDTKSKNMQNEALLMNLLQNYSKPDGSVDYKRAWSEHPTLRKTLLAGGTPQEKLYAPMNQLRKRLKKQGALPPPPPSPQTLFPLPDLTVRAGRKASQPEDVLQLINDIQASYSVNGVVRWSQAYREHPEWESKLLSDGRTKSDIYWIAQHQRDKARREAGLQNPRKARGPYRKRATYNEADRNGTHTLPAAAPAPLLAYCPRCGAHLEAVQLAMAAVQGI